MKQQASRAGGYRRKGQRKRPKLAGKGKPVVRQQCNKCAHTPHKST